MPVQRADLNSQFRLYLLINALVYWRACIWLLVGTPLWGHQWVWARSQSSPTAAIVREGNNTNQTAAQKVCTILSQFLIPAESEGASVLSLISPHSLTAFFCREKLSVRDAVLAMLYTPKNNQHCELKPILKCLFLVVTVLVKETHWPSRN